MNDNEQNQICQRLDGIEDRLDCAEETTAQREQHLADTVTKGFADLTGAIGAGHATITRWCQAQFNRQ